MNSAALNPRWAAVIEKAYEVFGTVPKPRRIEGCPCCIDDKNVDILLSKPLREITPNELSGYASSVFLTIGSLDDYLYLLPRILEVLAMDKHWYPTPEIVAASLRRGDVHLWPEERQAVVRDYFEAAFEAQMANPEADGHDLDSWLRALNVLFTDISSYLRRISGDRKKLLEIHEIYSARIAKGNFDGFPEEEATGSVGQTTAWLRSPEIAAAIQAAHGLYELSTSSSPAS